MCPYVESCKGSVDLWDVATPSVCTQGHDGPLCALCKHEFILNRSTGQCVKCRNRRKRAVLISLAIFLLVLPFVFVSSYVFCKHVYPEVFEGLSTRTDQVVSYMRPRRSKIGPMLKILYVRVVLSLETQASGVLSNRDV